MRGVDDSHPLGRTNVLSAGHLIRLRGVPRGARLGAKAIGPRGVPFGGQDSLRRLDSGSSRSSLLLPPVIAASLPAYQLVVHVLEAKSARRSFGLGFVGSGRKASLSPSVHARYPRSVLITWGAKPGYSTDSRDRRTLRAGRRVWLWILLGSERRGLILNTTVRWIRSAMILVVPRVSASWLS